MPLKLVFHDLWKSYGDLLVKFPDAKPCNGGYANQCAIRMGIVLEGNGVDLRHYTEPKCKHGHPRGAESLASWLWKVHTPPKVHADPAGAKKRLANTTGIIFFKDCFTREGQTARVGDHMDLWDRGQTKTFDDDDNNATQIWFWTVA